MWAVLACDEQRVTEVPGVLAFVAADLRLQSPEMDATTVRYYDEHAGEVYARYQSVPSPVARYLKLAFLPGAEILDIGAGSGRDLQLMIREEYAAYGVEPSEALRNIAIANDPGLAGRMQPGALPGLSELFPNRFDGVVCSAVFMHIPVEQHFDAAFDVRRLLKPNGRLLLSVPRSRPDISPENRDARGRLFVPVVPESLQLLFERLGFQCIGKWDDTDALSRPDHTWTTMLFRLASGGLVRPIDQIEGVLNRDRKVATYKLALFRALCDVALTSHRVAEWRTDGFVGIPMREIAERWIYYYWPLLEDEENFIPQIRGETRGGTLRIGFRPGLERLIRTFRHAGGLDAFAIALRNDTLDAEQRDLLETVSAKLNHVIREGPVTFAGGSLETGRLFSYDSSRHHVLIGSEIWRELSLSGHWIQDALILRWGELTSEISRKVISPSEVIDRLLRVPVFERNVLDARKVYQEMHPKECVWSGAPLGRSFEVDHVLPFSLWRNNDLWNLLPASRAVNLEKRDRLPSNGLLKRRRDAILGYWDALYQSNPRRFEHEVMRLAGIRELNLPKTFNVMLESVEVTALQRGCLRWEP